MALITCGVTDSQVSPEHRNTIFYSISISPRPHPPGANFGGLVSLSPAWGHCNCLPPFRTADGYLGAPGSWEESESHRVTLLSVSPIQDFQAEPTRGFPSRIHTGFSLCCFVFTTRPDVPQPRQAKLKTAGVGVRLATLHLRTSSTLQMAF